MTSSPLYNNEVSRGTAVKRNIHIEALNQIPLEKQRNELVERKCLGHPDSLADGIAESISQALCKTYLDEFGVVLHHNTDQGEVVAGESSPKFGGGRMIRPIFILIDGRATKQFNGVTIPTDAVAVEAATNLSPEDPPGPQSQPRPDDRLPARDRLNRPAGRLQAGQRQGAPVERHLVRCRACPLLGSRDHHPELGGIHRYETPEKVPGHRAGHQDHGAPGPRHHHPHDCLCHRGPPLCGYPGVRRIHGNPKRADHGGCKEEHEAQGRCPCQYC